MFMNWLRHFLQFIILSLFILSCSNKSTANDSVSRIITDPQMDSAERNYYNQRFSFYFDSLLNNTGFSGGILVAKNGHILYEHYQGFTDGARTEVIDSSTIFHVASTSKTITAHAIFQLYQQQKFELDDKVNTILSGFPYEDITIRHLLNHSAGLQNYANFLEAYKWDKKVNASNQDVLNVLAEKKPILDFKPGSRFRYCNTNFVMLALIVEKLSGQAFPDYVKEHIFQPAGMNNSYIVGPDSAHVFTNSFKANGVTYGFEFVDGIYGDKNVFTNVRDLLRYDNAVRHNILLDQETYDTCWTASMRDASDRTGVDYYGLGWRIKMLPNGLKIPYHNGWWHGNNAVYQHLNLDSAVIIVTGNKFNKTIYKSVYAANVFRDYYQVPAEKSAPAPKQVAPAKKKAESKKSGVAAKSSKNTKASTTGKKVVKEKKAGTNKKAPAKKKK